jgi:hypothetical protein
VRLPTACPKPRKKQKLAPTFSSIRSRGGFLKRTRKPAPRNKKRQAVEFARTFGSVARVRWIKSLPCLACLLVDRIYSGGKIENAHVADPGHEKGGSRRANHRGIVPLCERHHTRFDRWLKPFDDPNQREFIERQAERIAVKWDAIKGDFE